MSDISTKLTYLNETKQKLKDSLNKFGSNILSTDTFRSYDTKLNEIYDKLPKVTQSGAGFTLENVQNGQVDDFKMNGVDLEQNTTNGNQLVNFGSPTTGNPLITLSFNNEILTLTGESGQYVGIQYDLYNVITNSNNAGKTIKFGYKSISNITGSGSIAQINIYYKDSTPNIYRSLINRQGSISSTYTIPNDTSNIRSAVLVLYTNNGSPASTGSVTIEEPLVYFDNNNTYEPYTNGASPNPNYPQEIKVVEGRQVITDKGKNLLNNQMTSQTLSGVIFTVNADKSITMSGTASERVEPRMWIRTTDSLILNSGETYYNYSGIRLIFLTNSGYYAISDNEAFTPSTDLEVYEAYFRVEADESVNTTIYPMLTKINDNNYEPYYNPVGYNIDLQLANIYLAKMRNTDYKNKIYRNNGNWYFEEKLKKYILDGSETWDSASSITNTSRFYTSSNILNSRDADDNNVYIIADKFKGISWKGIYSADTTTKNAISNYNNSSNTSGRIVIRIDNNYASTTNEFKTWLSTHNTEVWCILATPTTTQITNTTLINQLEALYLHTGTNIITISNDNNIIPEIEITRLKELEKLA